MKYIVIYAIIFAFSFGCASQTTKPSLEINPNANVSRDNVDKLYVVDCLLPGQVRSLGTSSTFVTPRRPIKTSAADCEIRGGEYVAFDRADYATALKIWMPQAQAGDPNAQTQVGEIYEKGLGIAPDYEVAALWYNKAAKQGFSRAQINLGYLYEKGLGVEQDLAKAMNYYRQASGLPDEITYVSAVELSAQKEEIATLKEEVKKLEAEAEKYRKQLKHAQQKLKTAQNEQQGTENQINRLQDQIDTLQAALDKAEEQGESSVLVREVPQATVSTTTGQRMAPKEVQALIKNLFGELKEKQDNLQKQGVLIAKLHKETARYRQQLSSVEEQQVALSGPVIEILDPPLALTRGEPSVLLRSPNRSKEIYGKVTAPAGIKSFTFNTRKVFLRPDNSFKIPIKLANKSLQVSLVAIDKNNKRTNLDFVVTSPTNGSVKLVDSRQPPLITQLEGINVGSYHALIIGNNQYQYLPNLKTAVNDAKETDRILREKYGFQTTLLINADRYQILSALHQLRQKLQDNTNLLVYYAGHGDLDKVNDRGYWLPIDADADNTANWISNVAITDILNTLPSKHIMVIADSCYSGTMTRTAVPRIEDVIPVAVKKQWVKLMSKSRSRTVLSSGGVQPVLDEGGGNHSIFANAFLTALKNNSDVLQGYALYRRVVQDVSVGSANIQTPEYAPIKHAGHETGQFFFVPRS